ncbi:hypothetical protein TRFO_38095 [Tritrichomonas foetus]|uniref:L-type lectin-like domain-containing protein n=1 Tax=Tritrichomonas foetus TaxID=1144522 RepID=A0A1J4JAS0_9EUKA|nr:hypothetical protein TRFO_38095 [Tritrichomonas foetus]|eukprot:OHS95769.1 hypothetical protein TRFO_38095 [Tritrichomonas foetus]
MLFLYFSLGSALLNRTFIARSSSFSKEWEYSGAALYENQILDLVKKENEDFGAAWCTYRLPLTYYSLNFTFEIPTGDSAMSQFGIWLSKDFGLSGNVFGGPLCLKGLGILFKISKGKLEIQIVEKSKSELFEVQNFTPSFQIAPKSSKLNVVISKGTKLVITVVVDNEKHQIHENRDFVLKKSWIGVTAKNDQNKSPLKITSILIKIYNETNSINQEIIQSESYHQRKEIIEYIHNLSQKINNESFKPNSSEIVKVVDNLNYAVESISDPIDLNSIISQTMIPFTANWQKRNVKMGKQTTQFVKKIKEELNAVEQQFETFKKDITRQFTKFYKNISNVEDMLYYGVISFEFEYNSKIRDEKNNITKNTQVLYILLFCVLEAIFVALYFIDKWIENNQNNTTKVVKRKKRRTRVRINGVMTA